MGGPVHPAGGGATRRWGYGVGGLLLCLVLAPLLPPAARPCAFALLVVGAVLALDGDSHNGWSARSLVRAGAHWVPRFACFPVTRRELFRVRLKVAAVRAAAYLVPTVLLSAAVGAGWGWKPLESAALAAKLVGVYAAAAPIGLLTGFHALVTKEPRRWWVAVRAALLVFLWLILFAAGAGLLMANPLPSLQELALGLGPSTRSLFAVAGAGVLAVAGWGPYLAYGWIYARTDLVRTALLVEASPPGSARPR